MSRTTAPSDLSLVLFDLDGTLADTAADLIGALQSLADDRDLPLPPAAELRPLVSEGAMRLLQVLFDLEALPADDLQQLRQEFLHHYDRRQHRASPLFDGIDPLLQRLEHSDLLWGVVTSKPLRFAESLLQRLRLSPACLLCPEHTAHSKPHPEPVQAALKALNCAPERAVFAGDHKRDLLCGRAAGVRTIGCLWGYSLTEEDLSLCDFCAETPAHLAEWLFGN